MSTQAQIDRDNHGPPRKCNRCTRSVSRNLNGTWGSVCTDCRASQSKSQKKRQETRKLLDFHSESSDNDENDVCVDCGESARPRADGRGYCMRCVACGEEQSKRHKALHHLGAVKRAFLAHEKEDKEIHAKIQKLETQRNEIIAEIDQLGSVLAKSYEYELAYTTAKNEFMKLL